MIFHENRLPADDSHEISCLIKRQNSKCRLLQNVDGTLRFNLFKDDSNPNEKYVLSGRAL